MSCSVKLWSALPVGLLHSPKNKQGGFYDSKNLKASFLMSHERKVIKIGNSMGLTLPDRLKEVGIHIGQKVKIEPVNDHSLNLVFK